MPKVKKGKKQIQQELMDSMFRLIQVGKIEGFSTEIFKLLALSGRTEMATDFVNEFVNEKIKEIESLSTV